MKTISTQAKIDSLEDSLKISKIFKELLEFDGGSLVSYMLKNKIAEVLQSDSFKNEPVINVVNAPVNTGKSYYQNEYLGRDVLKYLPHCRIVIRISPTREIAYDGTFSNVCIKSNDFHYLDNEQNAPKGSNLDIALVQAKKSVKGNILFMNVTWGYFHNNFSTFLEYADVTLLCIEEIHAFLGCGVKGNDLFKFVIGSSGGTDYKAASGASAREWFEKSKLIIGFTGTPTKHHLNDFNGATEDQKKRLIKMFEVNEDMPWHKEHFVDTQAWRGEYNEYDVDFKDPSQLDYKNLISTCVTMIFNKEEKMYKNSLGCPILLKTLLGKRTGLFIVGNYHKDNAKNTPKSMDINGVLEHLTKTLLEDQNHFGNIYTEEDYTIALMQDKRCCIFNLKGETIYLTEREIIDKLNDDNDPLRFLIVNNKGRTGINVHNLYTALILKPREQATVRTMFPIQIFGRMVRLHLPVKTGKDYGYSISSFIKGFMKDYPEVDPHRLYRAICLSNDFHIAFPFSTKKNSAWLPSMQEFIDNYSNDTNLGEEYLQYIFSQLGKSLNDPWGEYASNSNPDDECPHCNTNLSGWLKAKTDSAYQKGFNDGRGTLAPFLEDALD